VTEGAIGGGDSGVVFHIIIFHTTRGASSSTAAAEITPPLLCASETLLSADSCAADPCATEMTCAGNTPSVGRGQPFEPSLASIAGKSIGITEAILSSLVFATIAWGGLYLVWYNYHNVQQHSRAIGNRMYSTLGVLALSVLAPLVAVGVRMVVNMCRSLSRGRYRYDALTSDSTTGGSAREEAVVGVPSGDDGLLPLASSLESQAVDDMVSSGGIGYNSLELKEDIVAKEMGKDDGGSGSSSGNTSVSSATMSEVEAQQTPNTPPIATDHDEGCARPSTACPSIINATEVVTPSETMMGSRTPTGVVIDHRIGRPVMEDLFVEIFEAAETPGIFMCGPALLLNAVSKVVLRGSCARRNGGGIGGRPKPVFPRCAIYEEGFEV